MGTNPLARIENYRKKQEERKRAQSPVAGAMPNVMHTGNGPDGIPQPDKPVGMIQTAGGPRMVHEDETMIGAGTPNPTVIPSPITMSQPDFEQQKQLSDIEDQTGMHGYQYGTPAPRPGVGKNSGHSAGSAANQAQADAAAASLTNPLFGYVPSGADRTKNVTTDTTNIFGAVTGSQTNPLTNTPSGNAMSLAGSGGAGAGMGGYTGGPPAPVVPVDTSTDTTVTTPDFSDGGFDATGAMEDFAKGSSEYYQDITNKALAQAGATNRENLMAGGAMLANNPYMTTGGAASAMAQMQSDANAQRGASLSAAGDDIASKMYGATQTLFNEEQSDIDGAYDKSSLAYQNYSSRLADLMGSPEYSRILEAGGDVNAWLAQDSVLQGHLNQMNTQRELQGLGEYNQLDTDISVVQGGNYQTNLDGMVSLLDDMHTVNGDLEGALADTKILGAAANTLGYTDVIDPATGEVHQEITDLITSNWETVSRSWTDVAVDYVDETYKHLFPEGVSDEHRTQLYDWAIDNQNNDDLWIRDDENNIIGVNKTAEMPWDNPESKYGDWFSADEKEVVWQDGVKKVKLEDGTTVDYDTHTYTDSNGNNYTTAEFDTVWDTLPSSTKQQYADEGLTPEEMSDIMTYGAGNYNLDDPTDNPYYDPTGELKLDGTSQDQWYMHEDDMNYLGTIKADAEYTTDGSGVQISHDLKGTDAEKYAEFWNKAENSGELAREGDYFMFYDDERNLQKIDRTNSDIDKMYYQASMMSGGEPLDIQEMAKFMEAGSFVWDGSTFIPASEVSGGLGNVNEVSSTVPDAIGFPGDVYREATPFSDEEKSYSADQLSSIGELVSSGQVVPISKDSLPNIDAWVSEGETNRHKLTDEAIKYVSDNTGQVVSIDNGNYILTGESVGMNTLNSKGFIIVQDIATGKRYSYNSNGLNDYI